MEQSDELRDLTLRFYEATATGDLSFLERYLSRQEGAVFLGTDPHERWEGFEAFLEAMRAQAEAQWGAAAGMQIIPGQLQAYREGNVGWVIDCDPLFRLPDGLEMPFRSSWVFRRENGEWKLVHVHTSIGVRNDEALLQVARRIQQALLPKEVPEPEGWEISPYYQPAREVGGDFYDFFELEEGRLGLVVGDATSKGVPAALVMATARSMLRAVAQASESPGEALRKANDPLVTDIPPNMFVTCFYAILDPESGLLRYANAGHDLPYLRRRGGECEELRAKGMPLGLMPGMSYEENEIVLDAGEAALFYSDGLVEAHDFRGEMFGFPRLRELVAEHADEERSLEEALLEELYTFVGEGWEQEDDITLLTLRRSGHP
ncbi:MAG: SpoIIE family protein phosphatase [Actinomycetota bacterium]|nr:SpoIIE family protein phosphatase [Actinomycetota bacterium]